MINSYVLLENDTYIFECPHCHQYVEVNRNEINCRIFRHAVYKNNMQQINPHASKEECDYLRETDKIYGCAKPFIFNTKNDGNFTVEICEYI